MTHACNTHSHPDPVGKYDIYDMTCQRIRRAKSAPAKSEALVCLFCRFHLPPDGGSFEGHVLRRHGETAIPRPTILPGKCIVTAITAYSHTANVCAQFTARPDVDSIFVRGSVVCTYTTVAYSCTATFRKQ